jgi:hypothetical protein
MRITETKKKKMPVEDKIIDSFSGKGNRKRNVHVALAAAGMTPAYGNIADVADATLYALEGEFGEAAWSMAAAIPIVGQMVSGRRAAKIAKDSGEKMITLYRGNRKWAPKEMVKEGKFVGGDEYSPMKIFVTRTKKAAHEYGGYVGKGKRILPKGRTLEFEVPKSFFDKHAKIYLKDAADTPHEAILFKKGLPKEFLKKVHK